MAVKRGHEIPTIDCALVTISVPGSEDELILDTASNIAVTPQIETTDAIRLVVKNVLRAQKPVQNVLVGNTIVLTDNVFTPELVQVLQGGTIHTNPQGRVTGYDPPVAGSTDTGSVFLLNAYSAIYDAAGIPTGYERITYPNCQGVPVGLSAQDDVFRVTEYTINSAPKMGEAPYMVRWIQPNAIPKLPDMPPLPPYTDQAPQITSGLLPDGTENEAYSQELAATGATPITWSVTAGTLPTGLTLSNAGLISGTPTAEGTSTFTVKATNGIEPDAVQQFQLVIQASI